MGLFSKKPKEETDDTTEMTRQEQRRNSGGRHQTDEDLEREYGARLTYCPQCRCERPVGHYPHYR